MKYTCAINLQIPAAEGVIKTQIINRTEKIHTIQASSGIR